MPLSWDIHPSVAWMAFSFRKNFAQVRQWKSAVFLGALEVDFVGASNFPYFFIFKRGFKRPLGL